MTAGPRRLVWLVVAGAAVWWAWHALHKPPVGRALDNGAELEWGDCWFDSPLWRPVHCGRLYTASEPGTEASRFALPVVYIPQLFWRRSAPPTLYIAGGPGGAAWLEAEAMDFWFDWADAADWPGDLVLYDQRGVGLSQPALSCPELRAARRELLPLHLPTEAAYRRVRDATRACRDRLLTDGVDLGRFTTALNAQDAIDVMRAMGLEQWDLYAVSYGSRVALEMLRRAPQHLRALVLDSVYPPEVNGELADAWLLQRSLEMFGRICELVATCSEKPAVLRQQLEQAFARVADEAIRARVRDPDGGTALTVVYDHEDLAWLVFEAMYQGDLIPSLPRSVRALAAGHLDGPMRSLIQDSVDALLDDSLSDPVASSVECHDTGPVDWDSAQQQLQRYPRVAEIKRLDWSYHVCRYWQSGAAPAEFRAPVRSAVPALLLAGEFDPVTPPEWAEQAARQLTRGDLFVFPGVGHGVLDSHSCAADLVRTFLAQPTGGSAPNCLQNL